MKKTLNAFLSFSVLIGSISICHAGQSEFCAGFEEGFKTVKGNNVMVPMCPMAPMTPMGSTDYREGLKAGMKKAGG